MLNDLNQMENFYHQQNIQLRKQIRQMDMQFKEINYNNTSNQQISTQEQLMKQQVNFLVIGPQKSGKSSLLKTMHFALNSHNNIEIGQSQLPLTVIKRFDIKKNKKYNIQGLSKMKETDQKRTISGFQFQTKVSTFTTKQISNEQKSNKIFQKYTNALQIIDNKILGCFSISSIPSQGFFSRNAHKIFSKNETSVHSVQQSQFNIKTVLLVLNILSKIQFEQISCMKFFLTDIRQKGIKTLIVLTHIDKLNKMKQNQKLILIEQRIQILKRQLDVKDRDDFICLQNYKEFGNNLNNKFNQNSNKRVSYQKIQSPNIIKNQYLNDYNREKSRFYQQPLMKMPFQRQSEFYNSQISNIIETQVPMIKYKYSQVNLQNNSQKQTLNAQISLSQHSNRINNIPKPINVQSYSLSQYNNKLKNMGNQNNKNSKNIYQTTNLMNNNSVELYKSNVKLSIRQMQGQKLQNNQRKKQLVKKSIFTRLNNERDEQKSNTSNIRSFYSQINLQNINQKQMIVNLVNKQEINYYSLKLLIKIIKENQKYNRQMKNRKIKWFCG